MMLSLVAAIPIRWLSREHVKLSSSLYVATSLKKACITRSKSVPISLLLAAVFLLYEDGLFIYAEKNARGQEPVSLD